MEKARLTLKSNTLLNSRFGLKGLLLAIMVAIPQLLISAPPLPHTPPAMFTDTTGKLYAHPELPLLFFIDTSAAGGSFVPLKQLGKQESSHILKTTGLHKLILNAGGKRNTFEIIADGHAPQTQAQFMNTTPASSDNIFYTHEPTEISFEPQSSFSPVKTTRVSINGEDYQHFTQKLTFTEDGSYVIRYFSTGQTGISAEPQTLRLVIDRQAPQSNHSITGDQHENILSERSSLELTATDNHKVKAIYYKLDDSNFQRYSGPIKTAGEGYHTLHYYATDIAGNKEETNSFTFFVDKTPPIIIEEITGSSYISGGREYSSGRSQLRITAIDNKAGVKEIYYTINDGEPQLYSQPVFLSAFSGDITIETFAVDNVNNTSRGTRSATRQSVPYVDLNAPEISHTLSEVQITMRDTVFVSPQTHFRIHATDRESGLSHIEYRINNGEMQNYTGEFSLQEYGYKTLQYYAWDNVENVNTDSFSVFVDNAGPEPEFHFSLHAIGEHSYNGVHIPAFPPQLVVFLSATDHISGTQSLQYILNDGKPGDYRGAIRNFEPGKVHTLEVIATDVLGNESRDRVTFYVTP